jgi:hypothetical protein
MTNPIFYVDEPAASPYPIVGDDPTERRGWGVQPTDGGELAVFPSLDQAEAHAQALGVGDVVEVDVILGHAPD